MSDEKNSLLNAHRIIDEAAKILAAEEWITAKLKTPDRVIEEKFVAALDNGAEETFIGYRVQHNNARGPYKGGLRYDTSINLREVEMLATLMTLKTAAANLPLGGAKGGIKFPRKPSEYSAAELERITKIFTKQVLKDNIGPEKDIPAPDMYTDAGTMAWIYDAYQKEHPNKLAWGVVTGKPLELHGSLGRNTATAKGALIVTKYFYKASLKGKRVLVQGAGKAGGLFAALAQKEEAILVGISDSGGGIVNPSGLPPVAEILKHKEKTGSVINFPGATTADGKNFLTFPCDILVLAATQNVLTSENAYSINCELVVEPANAPTTSEADGILAERGITVLPDVIANAGGVTVSYFEWVQNIAGFPWFFEKEIDERLTYTLETNAEEMFKTAKRFGVSYRLAAYVMAVDRLAKAMRLRGRQ